MKYYAGFQLFRVNVNRELFKVEYFIKVPRNPQSGLGQTITLTGYSSVLT